MEARLKEDAFNKDIRTMLQIWRQSDETSEYVKNRGGGVSKWLSDDNL